MMRVSNQDNNRLNPMSSGFLIPVLLNLYLESVGYKILRS